MIGPDETAIRGAWIVRGGRVVEDDNCRRIRQLIAGFVKERGQSDAGSWEVLYVDPIDGRYWERL